MYYLFVNHTDWFFLLFVSEDVNDDSSLIPANTAIRLPQEDTDEEHVDISDFIEHLTCRTVRIGSYKVVPTDDIIFHPAGIYISVPDIAEC